MWVDPNSRWSNALNYKGDTAADPLWGGGRGEEGGGGGRGCEGREITHGSWRVGDEDGDEGTGDCNDDKSVIEVDNLLGADISKTNNIKILKLTLNADENESVTSDNESVTSDNELEELDDLEDLEELENDVEEEESVSLFDLKSINISNLEEKGEEELNSIELRKQPVNKLRSIVAEKGLAVDPSKLKKPELLKLLGAE